MSTAFYVAVPALILPMPSAVAQTVGTHSFNIPGQPLGRALRMLADQSGIQIAYQTSIAANMRAQGVSGSMTTQAALARLLANSGLRYSFTGGNAVTLLAMSAEPAGSESADGSILLDPVIVESKGTAAIQQDGLAKDGYRASTISSLGPLGQTSIKDTPFSVSVVPRELIQNIQAQSPDDIFRISPTTRIQTPQGSGWSPMVNMRGFTTYDTAEDGLRHSFSHATSLEDKERIEVLTGLSGFLYGAAAPAGMINYVYKRPTIERLNSVITGTYGAEQKYIHGDFGGRIDPEGRAGYRLNIVKQGGDTAIDDQNINRFLVSGAIDWDITDRLKLELNAAYSKYKTDVPNSYWFFESGVPHGAAPDASKNWSQPWIRDEFEKTRLSGKLTYKLNDFITLRGAYMREYLDRPVQDHTMNSVRSPGEYYQIGIHSGRTKNIFDAAQAFADVSFDTGSISHKVTAGYHMYSDRAWQTSYSPNTGWIGPFPMSSPVHLPRPTFPNDTSSPYYQGYVRNHNFVIGDQIEFNERWSALVGVNYSRIMSRSLEASGRRSQPDYDEGRLSPSASLLFKPVPWMTVYGSYIEGLEQGGVAPDTSTNYGQVLAPMVSKQKEIGIKAEVGGMLLTGALFDIEKAYEFTNASGVYTQDGRQRHRGIEVTATGKLTDELTLLGGVTVLDAKVEGGEFDGKQPVNVAKVLAKLYLEYEIPAIQGLVLTGGVYYTGKQWANDVNDDRLAAYTTLDVGMRYTTERFGNPLTLRLNVSNLTNKNYWQNSYYLGAPRTVAFSAQMKF
ncbi:TonB-dependent receptor [Labrys sp. KNU-23]|uniref:TonB-dependent receptor n=1 Tax=Labrys sp. KNU-23 TaxID=2789216 RepID=UPI001FEE1190|nr:TonB-dependent receptor [Labrys sp. KNU-23]